MKSGILIPLLVKVNDPSRADALTFTVWDFPFVQLRFADNPCTNV
ncbi:MAG: hypothetical protein Q7T80_02245 [Methanoregula sp.]|jgi:hypothetical protein|nr:hypothetical protein [Methanoregula sp.]